MTPAEALTRAASLSGDLVSRMAHAVGWPKPYEIHHSARRQKVPTKDPHRNYYVGKLDDIWQAGIDAGVVAMVVGEGPDPDEIFSATPAGMTALRLRLEAEILIRANSRTQKETP